MNIHSVISGDKAMEQLKNYLSVSEFSSVIILADSNTRQCCIPVLLNRVPELNTCEIIEVPAGEESKTIRIAEDVVNRLLVINADRKSLLINLGGGMITDLGGFVASVYKRGIKFVNVPTSLLAMVDASVGGKTGVNSEGFKNVIGTFSLPEFVFINIDFLDTLPAREYRSAYSEIIKHILLSDHALWNKLIDKQNRFLIKDNISFLIEYSVLFKQNVVKEDFKETGERHILNFGHTLGHAFESAQMHSPNKLMHGEAVAAGIIGELFLSTKLSGLNVDVLSDAVKLITSIYNDISIDGKPEDLFTYLIADKKNVSSTITFSLLESLGKPSVLTVVDEQLIRESIQFILSSFTGKKQLVNDKH